MGNFKISVIIPCYNAIKYIDRCMTSLINQTIGFGQLEIILINDASTDETLEVLSSYENQYPDNILVINCSENGRQGTARNLGIQYSTSDYITFIDIDDWIESEMLDTMYQKAVKHDYDLIVCSFNRIIRNQKVITKDLYPTEQIFFIHDEESRKQILNLQSPCCGVWGALYKRSIIVDNNIYFPEHLTYEDNYWGTLIQYYINSLCIIPDHFYNYYLDLEMGSTSTKMDSTHHFDRLKVELLKIEAFQDRGLFSLYHDEIEFNFLQLFYINSVSVIATRFTYIPYEILNQMVKTVHNIFPNFMQNPYLKNLNQAEFLLVKFLTISPKDHDWDEIINAIK
ncbi:glycosyl transferase [Lachnospiraceae bacterium KM106-2]|nr:glycosyl transferase [Lachnospiraceae bacterium KM106-2]